ncbi:MAG TPA: hypothetical protein VGX93_05945, partial [Chthoniobacterales bacterium]|nr:hypothetical protein [Chthoniobacterales bacterium]
VSRSKSENKAQAFRLGTETRCHPRFFQPLNQREFTLNALKLSNFDSPEPDNSDTFVSSPLNETVGGFDAEFFDQLDRFSSGQMPSLLIRCPNLEGGDEFAVTRFCAV